VTEYDLSEFRALPWVRFMESVRVILRLFVAAAGAGVAYDGYLVLTSGHPSVTRIAAVGGLIVLWAVFAWLGLSMRAAASKLTVDDDGICLEFPRGRSDTRRWEDPRFRMRGRRTDGVDDAVSRRSAMQSIFGPRGGASESFVPAVALEEVYATAKRHGLEVRDNPSGRPGWILYSISR
jgi:hypothetical protein